MRRRRHERARFVPYCLLGTPQFLGGTLTEGWNIWSRVRWQLRPCYCDTCVRNGPRPVARLHGAIGGDGGPNPEAVERPMPAPEPLVDA